MAFCSRDCQRAGFDAHAADCTARPAASNDAGDASDDGDELGALSRRLRAAVRAAEAAVAGEEAGPAPDDNRAEARARRARYHSWWWDDDGAADDEDDGVGGRGNKFRGRKRRGRRRFCRFLGRRRRRRTPPHDRRPRVYCLYAPDDVSNNQQHLLPLRVPQGERPQIGRPVLGSLRHLVRVAGGLNR